MALNQVYTVRFGFWGQLILGFSLTPLTTWNMCLLHTLKAAEGNSNQRKANEQWTEDLVAKDNWGGRSIERNVTRWIQKKSWIFISLMKRILALPRRECKARCSTGPCQPSKQMMASNASPFTAAFKQTQTPTATVSMLTCTSYVICVCVYRHGCVHAQI